MIEMIKIIETDFMLEVGFSNNDGVGANLVFARGRWL